MPAQSRVEAEVEVVGAEGYGHWLLPLEGGVEEYVGDAVCCLMKAEEELAAETIWVVVARDAYVELAGGWRSGAR
jgi:hypothetical protein